MEIRVLARQGMSMRAIAQQLRVSRNTVRKYLRNPGLPYYPSRAARPTKLDLFKPYLHARIQSVRPYWAPAAVFIREIRERGYFGGLSQLKVWLSPQRQATPEPVMRAGRLHHHSSWQPAFEGLCRHPGVYRASYVHFFDHERSEAWLTGLREVCPFFGGIAHEVLFDNAAAIMSERDAYGEGDHRWQPALLALAEELGFRPRICRPYRA